jgi:phosphate transport system ATP-binding protein
MIFMTTQTSNAPQTATEKTSPPATTTPVTTAPLNGGAHHAHDGAARKTVTPAHVAPLDENNEVPVSVRTNKLNLHYGTKQALKNINTQVATKSITALIGPSGCGKSTFLRCLNRMNDLIDNVKIDGEVLLDNQNIYARGVDVVALRQRVGMVFQKPNPFPMSIFDNIAYGPRLRGVRNKGQLQEIVENSLRGRRVVGRSQRRIEEKRAGAFRWPATASLHRTRYGDAS